MEDVAHGPRDGEVSPNLGVGKQHKSPWFMA